MTLPKLENPRRYQGLYVFDFGDWCAVGYTAAEIATLLESDEYAHGKVYKIHRVLPDGQLELRGLSNNRFQLESGLFFARRDLDSATLDFETLKDAARRDPPPSRARLHLAGYHGEPPEFVTALIFPAEFEDEFGQWLIQIGFDGGTVVEGGISHVSDYESAGKTIFDRHQLTIEPSRPARPREEILSCVRQLVQR